MDRRTFVRATTCVVAAAAMGGVLVAEAHPTDFCMQFYNHDGIPLITFGVHGEIALTTGYSIAEVIKDTEMAKHCWPTNDYHYVQIYLQRDEGEGIVSVNYWAKDCAPFDGLVAAIRVDGEVEFGQEFKGTPRDMARWRELGTELARIGKAKNITPFEVVEGSPLEPSPLEGIGRS